MDEVTTKVRNRTVDLLKFVEQADERRMAGNLSPFVVSQLTARLSHLIHTTVGPKSSYAVQLAAAMKQKTSQLQFVAVAGVLQAFHVDVSEGHLTNLRHEVEAVVVSEVVSQARMLLKKRGIHPAAAVIVACAGAEEFLRNWCEERSISIPKTRRSLSVFAAELRKEGEFSLPVERRILSWADYRNGAAHGDNWGSITKDIASKLVKEVEDFLVDNRHVLGS